MKCAKYRFFFRQNFWATVERRRYQWSPGRTLENM